MFLSLIPFHRGLIATAIVFCFGYGGWELAGFARGPGGGLPEMGILFIALGLGLMYYLSRLGRFLGYEPGDRDER